MPTATIGDLSVAEIMSNWPSTIRIFLDRRMHCVGCPIAIFHSIADAAQEHHLDEAPLSEAIREVISRATADRASVRRR